MNTQSLSSCDTMDDKKVVALATTSEVESTALHPGELEYTEEEVTRARRKVDFRVLPLVVLMFCFLQFVSRS